MRVNKILVLFFISFAMCSCVAFALWSKNGTAAFYSPDTQSYIAPAEFIISSGTFGSVESPEIIRTPCYPLFLAPFLLIGEGWEKWAILAQAFIAGLTVIFAYLTAVKIASERAAFFGAALLSVSPLVATYSACLLTEVLCAFLLCLSCYFMLNFLEKRNFLFLCLSSIILTFAIFTRPAVLYSVYLVPCFIFVWGIASKIGAKKMAAYLLLFSMFPIMPVKAWEYRNDALTGFDGFSAVSSVNYYLYNGAATLARIEGTSYYEKAAEMSKKYPVINGETLNEMGREGRSIILNNLSSYLPIHAKGILMTFAIPGITDFLRIFDLFPQNIGFLGKVVDDTAGAIKELFRNYTFGMVVASLSFICLGIGYVLALLGVQKSFSLNFWGVLFLLCVALYMFFITGGPGGYSRFRVPITFIIAIFAGIGLECCLAQVRMIFLCKEK